MSVLEGVDLHPQNGLAALQSLQTVAERLYARNDPRAAFPEIYAVITRRAAQEACSPTSGFLEPAWIHRLMGRFCERYLETLAWSERDAPQDCTAWTIAYDTRRRTVPFQDVVLGLSAHINYDLPLGIAETIRESDPTRLPNYKHDHDYVNTLLRASIPESFERLAGRYGCRISQILRGRAIESVVLHVLSSWREHVWNEVLALLAGDPDVRARMERRSGLLARAIVAPALRGWPRPSAALPARAAPRSDPSST